MSDIEKCNRSKKATEEIQKICDELKIQVEEKTKTKYVEFKAVEYIEWSHPVIGENYVIKVHVGGESYDHLSVNANFSTESRQLKLLDVQQHKTKDDILVPFNL